MAEVYRMARDWIWESYGWKFTKQIWKECWSFGLDQLMPIFMAIAGAWAAIHYGIIPIDQSRNAYVSFVLPFGFGLAVYLAFQIVRAPFVLHHQQERRIRHLENKLEKAQPKEEDGISTLLGQYLKNEPQRQHTEAMVRLAREMERQRSPIVSRVQLAQKGPIATVKFAYENQRVYLLVTNSGVMADFYGLFSIIGGTSDLPCRWMHDPSVKTRIVKDQTCRVLLAELVTEHSPIWTMRWRIFSATGETMAPYTSVPNAQPEPARAPDLILNGAVMAEPDLENGIQKFGIVLEAFGARLAKSSDYV